MEKTLCKCDCRISSDHNVKLEPKLDYILLLKFLLLNQTYTKPIII